MHCLLLRCSDNRLVLGSSSVAYVQCAEETNVPCNYLVRGLLKSNNGICITAVSVLHCTINPSLD